MAITARQMFRNSRDSRWGTQTLIGNHPLIITKCNSPWMFHLHGVHDWVNHYGLCVTDDHGYVPFVIITIRSVLHSWRITVFVTRVARWMPLVEQELFTLHEHPSSPPVFSRVRVTQSLVYCVVFCRSFFVLYVFCHFVVCLPSIDGFWLPLWYLQIFLASWIH